MFLPNINAWNKIKKIPSVGIGGINIRNIIKVIDLQLEFVALSSSVWKSKIRPYLALKKIKKLIDNF